MGAYGLIGRDTWDLAGEDAGDADECMVGVLGLCPGVRGRPEVAVLPSPLVDPYQIEDAIALPILPFTGGTARM